jgi:hypothetical protein
MNRHTRRLPVALLALLLASCGSEQTAPDQTHSPPAVSVSDTLAGQLGQARAATARYATDLGAAERDGYVIITPMMDGMGYHYLNPEITEFDPARPPILVYIKDGDQANLVALEWVWPEQPATPPLEGATYGFFDAACHYQDGTFVPVAAEADCASTSPDSGSPFSFWHPDLVTLHVWLWLHNPAGIYNPTNPIIAA